VKTLKTGHLIHWDGPGGGPNSVSNLVRGLKQRGVEPVVICGGRGRLAAFCEQHGIKRMEVPIHRKSTLLWGFFRLLWVLKRCRPDTLFVHGQWAGPVGAIAGWLLGIPTVYIAHWPAFYTDWNPWRAFRNAIAEWVPCRLSRWVVALTPSVHYQYLFRYWAKGDKLRLIPNFLCMEELPTPVEIQSIRKKMNWTNEQVHVVSVGRLADQKRVDWLIQAWRKVVDTCPQARLWIIGDGPEKAQLQALARSLNITDTCCFLGELAHGIGYLGAGDIAVMTTMYEAYGYIPLEAMACHRPIVVTAADGVRDHVTDGVEGRLVPPGDISRLADALIELIEDPELRRRMGEAGRDHISRMSSDSIIDQYLQLLSPHDSMNGKA
jgi:glycosyltransferase involved in cell wall biosynthesis